MEKKKCSISIRCISVHKGCLGGFTERDGVELVYKCVLQLARCFKKEKALCWDAAQAAHTKKSRREFFGVKKK